MTQCLTCEAEFDNFINLRKHIISQHPRAMFTPALKKGYVDDASDRFISSLQAQPWEWMEGQPAICYEIAHAVGANESAAYFWGCELGRTRRKSELVVRNSSKSELVVRNSSKSELVEIRFRRNVNIVSS